MNKRVYLVTESDGFFGQRLMPWEGMNLDELEKYLAPNLVPVRISWMQLVNRDVSPSNEIIIHSSSQQPEYKSFIDDIMLHLAALGNQLVPTIHMTRCHDNKGYQELLKRRLGVRSLESTYFAKPKEVNLQKLHFPIVLKDIAGFGSEGVSLIESANQFLLATTVKERLQWTSLPRHWKQTFAYLVRKFVLRRRNLTPYGDYYRPLRRFLVQQFIPNLKCDYKVLAFQRRIFVACRGVRLGDFRASGSGIIDWPTPPEGLLDFAEEILSQFDEPYISLDVAYDGQEYHLIEFQGLHFGPLLVMKAPIHYLKRDGAWMETSEKVSLEAAVGESLSDYLSK